MSCNKFVLSSASRKSTAQVPEEQEWMTSKLFGSKTTVTVAKTRHLKRKSAGDSVQPPSVESSGTASSHPLMPESIFTFFPNAMQIEQQFQNSKDKYQASEIALRVAEEIIAEDESQVRSDIKIVLEELYEVLKLILAGAQDKWDVETVQKLLSSFTKHSSALKNLLEESHGQLVMEQDAQERYEAARTDLARWEEKKHVLEQAVKAIEALKNL